MQKVVLEKLALLLGEIAAVDEHDALLGELAAQCAPARLLVGGERRRLGADLLELLGRRQPVGAGQRHLGAHEALKAGDAHHEELVEVVGGDGEEAQLLEQRMVRVRRLLQHPAIEAQPRQLAVDEALGALPQVAAGGVARRQGLGGLAARDVELEGHGGSRGLVLTIIVADDRVLTMTVR
jgi:hypothetical protein